eukprot:4105847-Heterocapsa_arctica.AAC.1
MPEVPLRPRGDRGDRGGCSRAPAHERRAGVPEDVVQDEPADDEERNGSAGMGLGKRNGKG